MQSHWALDTSTGWTAISTHHCSMFYYKMGQTLHWQRQWTVHPWLVPHFADSLTEGRRHSILYCCGLCHHFWRQIWIQSVWVLNNTFSQFQKYCHSVFERAQNWNLEDLHFNLTKPDNLQASQDANVLKWKNTGEGRDVLKSVYGPILLEHFLDELSGAWEASWCNI